MKTKEVTLEPASIDAVVAEKPDTNILIVTNPARRCIYCKGREVLTIDLTKEQVIDSSLEGSSIISCKNKKECSGNSKADNTDVSMVFKGDKMVSYEIANGKNTIVKVDRGESEGETFGK